MSEEPRDMRDELIQVSGKIVTIVRKDQEPLRGRVTGIIGEEDGYAVVSNAEGNHHVKFSEALEVKDVQWVV